MREFKEFLRKSRKSNGDRYLTKTIEIYEYNIERYKEKFDHLLPENPEECIKIMNDILKRNPHENLRASFKAYLVYQGVDPESNVLKTLRIKERRSSALNSARQLSSKVLSREELKRLYEEANDYWKLVIGMLYDTACRESEMLGLRKCDVYPLDNPSEAMSAKVIINAGKGGKKREVYISRDTHERLNNLFSKKPFQDDDLIFEFFKPDGDRYKRQAKYLIDKISKLSRKILGRSITPHHFRHTKLTHLSDEGADGYGISRYAGHSDVKESQIYLKNSKYAGRNAYLEHSRSIRED